MNNYQELLPTGYQWVKSRVFLVMNHFHSFNHGICFQKKKFFGYIKIGKLIKNISFCPETRL